MNEKWTIKPDPDAELGRAFYIVSDTANEWKEWQPRIVLTTVNAIHQADDGPLRRATLAAAAPDLLAALTKLIEQAEAKGIDCADGRAAMVGATAIDEALLPESEGMKP
jgi:hypothetical protein